MIDDTGPATISTPLGRLIIASRNGLIYRISFDEATAPEIVSPALAPAAAQLHDYFAGTLITFDLPLEDGGTPFQKAVWQMVKAIPYGKTKTYGEIASELGIRNGARAVGLAVGANPLLIAIPCHRVLGSQNRLTGYAAGIERKKWLLMHEAGHLPFVLKG